MIVQHTMYICDILRNSISTSENHEQFDNNIINTHVNHIKLFIALHKGNNKITELRTILQRESQNS
jgi:hypothetical protein